MLRRLAYLEPLLFATMASALTAMAVPQFHLHVLNAIWASQTWLKRSDTLSALSALYAASALILSARSIASIRLDGQTLTSRAVGCLRSLLRECRSTCTWLFTQNDSTASSRELTYVVLIGIAVRFFFLAQPMRYDEAFTFLSFVQGGLKTHFFYPLPNNHVLHTLLVRCSTELFGANHFAIRLPAVLAGIANIPFVYFLTRRVAGRNSNGLVAAAFVAVTPYVVLFDTMARGYSLLVLLSLVLVALGLRLIERPSVQISMLTALVISAGLLVMPSFVFPAAGVLSWVIAFLLQRRTVAWILTQIVVPSSVLTAILTMLLYTPVIVASNGVDTVINNRFVKALPWDEFLGRLPYHFWATGNDVSRDIPTLFVICTLLLFLIGAWKLAQSRGSTKVMLFPAMLVGAAMPLFAKHAIPFSRTWLYILPLVFVGVDLGVMAISARFTRHLRVIVVAVTGCVGALLMASNRIATYKDTGAFVEAPMLADILIVEMSASDRIVAKVPADAPVAFYTGHPVSSVQGATNGGSGGRDFFVVKPSRYSLSELTSGRVQKLMQIGDAELYVSESGKSLPTTQETTVEITQ